MDLIRNIPILIKKENSTIDLFIENWKKFYESDKNKDSIYFENLRLINELTEDSIQKLFEWKNGMRLSPRKQESVDKIKKDLTNIVLKFEKSGKSEKDLKEIYDYSYKFFKDGYIWNLFFLHILKYDICPIADMYAYRAFNYICNGENELPVYNWDTYIKYLDFFNEIATKTNRITNEKRKEIDEAFWGFGKFLSSSYAKIITEGTQ